MTYDLFANFLREMNLFERALTICARYGTSLEEAHGRKQQRHVACARGDLMLLLYEECRWSCDVIAGAFNRAGPSGVARLIQVSIARRKKEKKS